jgi:hypothetical protein
MFMAPWLVPVATNGSHAWCHTLLDPRDAGFARKQLPWSSRYVGRGGYHEPTLCQGQLFARNQSVSVPSYCLFALPSHSRAAGPAAVRRSRKPLQSDYSTFDGGFGSNKRPNLLGYMSCCRLTLNCSTLPHPRLAGIVILWRR